MAAAARSGELGFKTDDDVRAYVRKRKRANKNCSVSHLRRALNIGYKKAKRIHDEVDDELRRERQERRDRGEEPRHHPSRSRGVSHYDGSDDAEEDDPHHLPIDDDEADLLEEALREYIRKKLRRGEVIYMHHMRDFGLTYRRTRHIVQEFIDQGKIQKLPKTALGGRSAVVDESRAHEAPIPSAEEVVKMKPLKQKVKEENKKAAESQLKLEPESEERKDDHDGGHAVSSPSTLEEPVDLPAKQNDGLVVGGDDGASTPTTPVATSPQQSQCTTEATPASNPTSSDSVVESNPTILFMESQEGITCPGRPSEPSSLPSVFSNST